MTAMIRKRSAKTGFHESREYPDATRGQLVDGHIYKLGMFAHRADVTINTVEKWIENGLPCINLNGLVYIDVSQWKSWGTGLGTTSAVGLDPQ
ncbi:MAG: hypothetical protein E6R03_12345 [Hyphomicrobiaceae bacterium]|nr:MAG: hypothetical protein E6R03_12345 [Hyphomicrobiaceae bacterium]